MRSTQEDMDNLLNEWSSVRGYGPMMCRDGVLNEDYWDTTPRILFLLKDTYNNFLKIAPAPDWGYGPDGSSRIFWRNINTWKYILSKRWAQEIPDEQGALNAWKSPVKDIAYINKHQERAWGPTCRME